MTIDTTKLRELAQKADQGEGQHLYTHPRDTDNWEANVEYIAAANPAVVLALLDELDRTKGSVAIAGAALSAAEREVQRLRTIEAAARNLAKVKGRHHSEQAMNRLLETLKS